ncbi:BED-type domain-containing protein [Abeliophyllum distichum]|uniref:BED-type domain-containing protein n=1 Tax=Abeliophyllum distichum TaxID=126358 RepID=A0ABD1TYY3_9LAMI
MIEESDNMAPSNDTHLSSDTRPSSTLGKRKSNRLASYVWDHFTLMGPRDDPNVRCKCNYCGIDYACGTKKCGTSTLSNHLTNNCKKYPGRLQDKKQKILSFENQKEGGGSNLIAIGRSKVECRVACAKMVILDELPFRFVEAHGFRLICSVACPQFEPPSRRTLGETIGKMIVSCLNEWGIDKIFTITVDNATSNDTAISYLRRKVVGWGNDGCPLDGRYLHLRCCAHIINLIVCDGLREAHDSIVGIRNAVKYVKSSPARWNSTYLMLETALKFQKAFDRLEEDDAQYLNYFREDEGGRRRGGPSSSSDWENASVFVKFLKNFFNVTLTFSTSLNVSAPTYLHEISNLVIELDQWSSSSDFLLGEMASNMKKKFDKYWGKMDNVNQLLLVATLLDPRYKLDYVEYCFVDIYKNVEVASSMTKMVKANLMSIYEWYLESEGVSGSNEVTNEATSSSFNSDKGSSCCSTSEARLSRFDEKQTEKNLTDIKNDVERYLLDARESVKNKDFDVLNWWKVNKSKYGILSNIARDVLAIQVSTVALESAFSTGGRILDPFRSSLSPKIVEVLICTQNWLKASPNLDGFFMEDIEHCNQLEAVPKAGNGPLLQPIQPQEASAAFVYTEAPELFQCHTIDSSFAHGNCLHNVVRISIGGRDHFDLFLFNPHILLATVKEHLRIFLCILPSDRSRTLPTWFHRLPQITLFYCPDHCIYGHLRFILHCCSDFGIYWSRDGNGPSWASLARTIQGSARPLSRADLRLSSCKKTRFGLARGPQATRAEPWADPQTHLGTNLDHRPHAESTGQPVDFTSRAKLSPCVNLRLGPGPGLSFDWLKPAQVRLSKDRANGWSGPFAISISEYPVHLPPLS